MVVRGYGLRDGALLVNPVVEETTMVTKTATAAEKKAGIRFIPSLRFNVSQDDINLGTPKCASHCAGVMALQRAGATRVHVAGGKVSFTIGGWRYHFQMPLTLQKFTCNYDEKGRKGVKPTRFTLFNGHALPSGRNGAPDKTQHLRHRPGGRAARIGYKGPRVVLTKLRSGGLAVYNVTTKAA